MTLIGGGDAFLSSDELRGLVRELVQQGLRRVRGAAVTVVDPLHAGDRFGEGWMWDDEPGAFMPPVSAAAVDGGCVTVEVRAAADGGMAARLLPVAGPFALDAAASDGPLRVTRGVYTDRERVTVRGHVDGQRAVRRRLSAPDPARYTASVLAGLLAEEGLLAGEPVCTVVASAPVFAAGAPRAVLHRPIADVVARTNKPSDNLGAELLLRRLGAPLDAGPRRAASPRCATT